MNMDTTIVRISWIIVATLLSGIADAQPGPFSLNDYSGAEIYQRFCSSCHGESAHGDGPVAGTLAVGVPDLTQLYRRYGNRFPAVELRETIDGRNIVIAHGARTMPVWGYEFWWEDGADVEAEATARTTIDKLLDYIRSIQEIP
jgi:mono/diheme cytochrome c family protein